MTNYIQSLVYDSLSKMKTYFSRFSGVSETYASELMKILEKCFLEQEEFGP